MKKVLSLSLFFLLVACSNQAKQELKIDLSVDGKSVIQAHATDEKISTLENEHQELISVIFQACEFSKFLSSSVSSSTSETAQTSSKTTASIETSTLTSTSIKAIEIPGKIIACHSGTDGLSGCTIAESTSEQPQVQYTLNARNLMIEKYGMKQEANWSSESIERDGKQESIMKTKVLMTQTQLQCSEQFLGQ